MDGTDCRINEPSPFNPKWFSHKFKGPGIRYEIGICIVTGDIVWVHGGFPCGAWPDLRIARHAIVYELDPGEQIIADGGYRDGFHYFDTPSGRHDYRDRLKSEARARHETVNSRLKQFNVLSGIFRHQYRLHPMCFMAVAHLTQFSLDENYEE